MRDAFECLFQFFLPPALYGAIEEQGPQLSKKINLAIRNTSSQEITAQDTWNQSYVQKLITKNMRKLMLLHPASFARSSRRSAHCKCCRKLKWLSEKKRVLNYRLPLINWKWVGQSSRPELQTTFNRPSIESGLSRKACCLVACCLVVFVQCLDLQEGLQNDNQTTFSAVISLFSSYSVTCLLCSLFWMSVPDSARRNRELHTAAQRSVLVWVTAS